MTSGFYWVAVSKCTFYSHFFLHISLDNQQLYLCPLHELYGFSRDIIMEALIGFFWQHFVTNTLLIPLKVKYTNLRCIAYFTK